MVRIILNADNFGKSFDERNRAMMISSKQGLIRSAGLKTACFLTIAHHT